MLPTVNLSALKEAENVVVRLTLSFVLLFLAFCVFFHHNKSYHSSAACQNHSLTLLPYKTSIQQTNQQISGNRELVDVKLPELTTVANFIVVRDNPSSNGFIVVTRTTAPKLTVPPFNTNKTTTDHWQREPRRHQHSCAGDIEFSISGTQRVTTTSHRRRPPHPSIICFASPMSTIYLFHLFPHSRYIHRHNNTKLTYHPPSPFSL